MNKQANNKQKGKVIDATTLVDINNGELSQIEEILYANHILQYNNKFYIVNSDIEIDEEEFNTFSAQFPNHCRIGRNYYPIQAFEILKTVFYSLQLEISDYDLYILRDPSGIDNENLLDECLVSGSPLHSVVKKLDLGISEEEIYVFQYSTPKKLEEIIAGHSFRRKTADILYILDNIIKIFKKTIKFMIMPYINMQSLKKGTIYHLYYDKGLVKLINMGNILEIRYNNIIKISKDNKTSNKIFKRPKNNLGDESNGD